MSEVSCSPESEPSPAKWCEDSETVAVQGNDILGSHEMTETLWSFDDEVWDLNEPYFYQIYCFCYLNEDGSIRLLYNQYNPYQRTVDPVASCPHYEHPGLLQDVFRTRNLLYSAVVQLQFWINSAKFTQFPKIE